MPNLRAPDFDQPREHPGFRCRRALLGRQAGGRRLGLSLWEVEAGQAAYPLHYHLGEEELIVVLDGEGELRTSEGWRALEEGEVLSFLPGADGAHQLRACGSSPLRFLAISTAGAPDICVYPDSGKLGANERRTDGEGLWQLFRSADAVDYWDGERPPERP